MKFIEASILDLAKWTQFVHSVRPSFRNKLVFGIEETKDGDRNVKFHLMNRKKETDEDSEETEIFMVAAEYILEYYGKDVEDDSSTS